MSCSFRGAREKSDERGEAGGKRSEGFKGLKPHETSLSLVDHLRQAQCGVGFLAARNSNSFHSH